MIFSQELRASDPKYKGQDGTKLLGEAWRVLSAEVKQEFEARYQAKLAEYQIAIGEWKAAQNKSI